MTNPNLWDMHQVVNCLREVDACEIWLKARAKAAGLELNRVAVESYGHGQGLKLAIRLGTGRACFKERPSGTRARAQTHASAFSLDEFDRIVAAAVAYQKARS